MFSKKDFFDCVWDIRKAEWLFLKGLLSFDATLKIIEYNKNIIREISKQFEKEIAWFFTDGQ